MAQARLTAGQPRRGRRLAPPVALPPGIPGLTWPFTCRSATFQSRMTECTQDSR